MSDSDKKQAIIAKRVKKATPHLVLLYAFFAFMLADTFAKNSASNQRTLATGMVFLIEHFSFFKMLAMLSKLPNSTYPRLEQFERYLGLLQPSAVIFALIYSLSTQADADIPPGLFTSAFTLLAIRAFLDVLTKAENKIFNAFKTILVGATALGICLGLEQKQHTEEFGYLACGVQAIFAVLCLLGIPEAPASNRSEQQQPLISQSVSTVRPTN